MPRVPGSPWYHGHTACPPGESVCVCESWGGGGGGGGGGGDFVVIIMKLVLLTRQYDGWHRTMERLQWLMCPPSISCPGSPSNLPGSLHVYTGCSSDIIHSYQYNIQSQVPTVVTKWPINMFTLGANKSIFKWGVQSCLSCAGANTTIFTCRVNSQVQVQVTEEVKLINSRTCELCESSTCTIDFQHGHNLDC